MPRVIELLDKKKLKPCSIDRILNICSNGTWVTKLFNISVM